MTKTFNKDFATVYVKEGVHFVLLPNGIDLPGITETIVLDSVDKDQALLTVSFVVNLVPSREEAIKKYSE